MIKEILAKKIFQKDDLIKLLETEGEDKKLLFQKANEIKIGEVGKKVYYRGLIEFSNICSKSCYYCGIRKDNDNVNRFNLSDVEILSAAKFSHDNNYGSLVLQAGEIESAAFTIRIEKLLKEINKLSSGKLGITLSLGEQSEETYQRWFDAGAHRYLLRIESSNKELYRRIHPENKLHSFEKRNNCLENLQEIGYQTGTGVMIGLPFQKMEDLAEDLLFMKEMDVDMVGMGPYIEHPDTPLWKFKSELIPIQERFNLALKMIATLRILLKDINIAAATALQAIDPLGREKAVKIGANIIMPNITPGIYRNDYSLYENKPCVDEEPEECLHCLDVKIKLADAEIGYGEWGDSKHFFKRTKTEPKF
ncbi:MAG: [FeFe] hydrogenase H-cluster radical SAM maturase HydE [Bacteroidales bacterium]|nr:[FeFe] hydrogenase H-cluster radical SAM maturase HydE [Bacteroidales bacterium]